MPLDIHPHDGKIGGVKKEYVYAGVAVAGVILIVVYMRNKQASASANSTTVTDPAGNTCAALSPTSGYCPGTPEDLAYQGTGASGTLAGMDSASYVGGQIIGYDQYGNPIYSSNGQQSGVPGGFTNNAQWTQAAIQEMVDLEPSADPSVIAAALGLYIAGQPVTTAQQSVIQQAIALEGYPPVGGTNGNPPGIVLQSSNGGGTGGGGSGGTGGGTITVPNVVSDTVNKAHATLQAAGLSYNTRTTADKPGFERIVTKQNPVSGKKVAKGSKVSLTWQYQKVNPGGKNIPPKA